jgi:hypothetical protein
MTSIAHSDRNLSLPFLSAHDVQLAKSINERVVRALRTATGRPYRRGLYGGFMTTADGVRLIEYNARFGDPEAVNVLSILDLDLLEICWNAAIGDLASVAVRFAQKATVCKSVVPEGYPGSKRDGDEVGVDVPNESPRAPPPCSVVPGARVDEPDHATRVHHPTANGAQVACDTTLAVGGNHEGGGDCTSGSDSDARRVQRKLCSVNASHSDRQPPGDRRVHLSGSAPDRYHLFGRWWFQRPQGGREHCHQGRQPKPCRDGCIAYGFA